MNPEELGEDYLEGDIMPSAKSRNGLKAESARWKGGKVPYKISDKFSKLKLTKKKNISITILLIKTLTSLLYLSHQICKQLLNK